LPDNTLAENAEYLDQTNVYDLQLAAAKAGKRHVFLVIFDGMDWDTTRAAAIYRRKCVAYDRGRGTGTHFQDYPAAGTSQFAFLVTSPHNEGTKVDVDQQQVLNVGGELLGGYDPIRGGPDPWTPGSDSRYLISQPAEAGNRHAYADSSSSATSMTAGIKTYNDAVNVDPFGRPVETIAHKLQQDGWGVGAVTSVPISHATPAAAYAQNVYRDDYQDLTRDMLGLPSISHPKHPLPGLDVLIGCGYGVESQGDRLQGSNYVPGNRYLTASDQFAVDVRNGGQYVVAQRTSGVSGAAGLQIAVSQAVHHRRRLLGFYGTPGGNLPYQTANGDFEPAPGRNGKTIIYTPEDIPENPTLAEMTAAAIRVLEANRNAFWLLVEAGDVDWANHDNNLDNSIGAVASGDAAVRVITDWVEQHSNWNESLLIVTADHGHFLVLDRPELLAE
jgi:alkaline phosphatase